MSNPTISGELSYIITLARKADTLLLPYHGNCGSTKKADGSLSIYAEKEMGRTISTGLQEKGYLVVNEEEPERPSGSIPKKGIAWVDPLDGTDEFIQGTGRFWTLIGIAQNDIPVMGVAYNPFSKELFFAEDGKCYRETNGRIYPVQLSSESDLSHMKLTWTTPTLTSGSKLEQMVTALGTKVIGVGVGPANKVTAILRGEAHLTIQPGKFGDPKYAYPWDDCALHALLRNTSNNREGYGVLTDLWGNPMKYDLGQGARTEGFVASTGISHKEIIEEIARVIS
ncbi:MAG: inositol monophosphatase family protein [Nanoarchaeota archaeon]